MVSHKQSPHLVYLGIIIHDWMCSEAPISTLTGVAGLLVHTSLAPLLSIPRLKTMLRSHKFKINLPVKGRGDLPFLSRFRNWPLAPFLRLVPALDPCA